MLCGLEIDLRDDKTILERLAKVKQKPITTEAGMKLARELKLQKYVECSALTGKGLKNVFNEAIIAAVFESPAPYSKKKVEFGIPTTLKKIFNFRGKKGKDESQNSHVVKKDKVSKKVGYEYSNMPHYFFIIPAYCHLSSICVRTREARGTFFPSPCSPMFFTANIPTSSMCLIIGSCQGSTIVRGLTELCLID